MRSLVKSHSCQPGPHGPVQPGAFEGLVLPFPLERWGPQRLRAVPHPEFQPHQIGAPVFVGETEAIGGVCVCACVFLSVHLVDGWSEVREAGIQSPQGGLA